MSSLHLVKFKKLTVEDPKRQFNDQAKPESCGKIQQRNSLSNSLIWVIIALQIMTAILDITSIAYSHKPYRSNHNIDGSSIYIISCCFAFIKQCSRKIAFSPDKSTQYPTIRCVLEVPKDIGMNEECCLVLRGDNPFTPSGKTIRRVEQFGFLNSIQNHVVHHRITPPGVLADVRSVNFVPHSKYELIFNVFT